ncbi:DinB family protein [Paenibacillus ferrarius]|uniref:DinB family protein n=1 Tax=Paenibacillus ferrarius TaxID=1469647 RepID=UPI003D2DDD96
MNFNIREAMEILERTPHTLTSMLSGLSDSWLHVNEGEGTWTVSEVLDHLITLEFDTWMSRLGFILESVEAESFPAFELYAWPSEPMTLEQKLREFRRLREESLAKLRLLFEGDVDLEKTGIHPRFGVVKARELLSTWTVHDLTHTAQITRVMAKRYQTDVGPWIAFLSILKK